MDEDDDDEEEEDEVEEDDDDEEMEEAEALDTEVILPPGTRRSTRAKVDYSSKEAMERAGVKPEEEEDGEHEESFSIDKDETS